VVKTYFTITMAFVSFAALVLTAVSDAAMCAVAYNNIVVRVAMAKVCDLAGFSLERGVSRLALAAIDEALQSSTASELNLPLLERRVLERVRAEVLSRALSGEKLRVADLALSVRVRELSERAVAEIHIAYKISHDCGAGVERRTIIRVTHPLRVLVILSVARQLACVNGSVLMVNCSSVDCALRELASALRSSMVQGTSLKAAVVAKPAAAPYSGQAVLVKLTDVVIADLEQTNPEWCSGLKLGSCLVFLIECPKGGVRKLSEGLSGAQLCVKVD